MPGPDGHGVEADEHRAGDAPRRVDDLDTLAGRTLGELPERVAVSVVTIGELQLGVLVAPTTRRAHAVPTRSRW